jgi:hypothetical protein
MEDSMTLPDGARETCEAFHDGLEAVLGEKLHGLYLYGALAFPETTGTFDLDFHVVLTDPLTDDERSRLESMHEDLAREFPGWGDDMDGYYLLLGDFRPDDPPRSEMWRRAVDDSWALHCRHIGAGRYVALHGPDPKDIYPSSTWPAVERALLQEMVFVTDHLEQYPHYCVLQMFRVVYSLQTRDVVVSKRAAADWASREFPDWRPHIEAALRFYAKEEASGDRELLLAGVHSIHEMAQARIARCRGHHRRRDDCRP